MLSTAKIEFLILLFVTIFQTIFCECKQSYVTICDSFDDLKENHNTPEWSELIIGSDESSANESVNLMETLKFFDYNKLISLHVVQKIKQLQLTYAHQCDYHLVDFKLFSFYGNEFTNIEPYHFPKLAVKKFSLINNKIETIQKGALVDYKAEIFDLSDNLLEDIAEGTLPSTEKTKVITIKNNKLTHIESGSFPSSLKSLNLDINRLRFLESGVLDNLTALRELTLSNNKFRKMPNISHLKELIVFDISSNTISTIDPGTFEPLNKLQLLDLSTNKIIDQSILSLLLTPTRQPKLKISLAFNYIRGLNLTNISLKEEQLILFGNPWDCTGWEKLSKTLLKYQSRCDLNHFSSGKLPYCINYKSENFLFDHAWEEHIQRFHNSIHTSAKLDCQLAPNKMELLLPVDFTCVA